MFLVYECGTLFVCECVCCSPPSQPEGSGHRVHHHLFPGLIMQTGVAVVINFWSCFSLKGGRGLMFYLTDFTVKAPFWSWPLFMLCAYTENILLTKTFFCLFHMDEKDEAVQVTHTSLQSPQICSYYTHIHLSFHVFTVLLHLLFFYIIRCFNKHVWKHSYVWIETTVILSPWLGLKMWQWLSLRCVQVSALCKERLWSCEQLITHFTFIVWWQQQSWGGR